ncbi:ribonuclease D [Salinicola avicenniae]|uniref:ribonuclease D n=1 Tax=Salinicola avicenniae TaxID=2916836 RepID=UPI0020749229|nr:MULTISPECIES: ribonuclease D [unclassified Salinicola]
MTVEMTQCWVDTPENLQAACDALSSAEVLALDTEFFRESTFYPVPALIQLSAGSTVFLIDPQAVAATPAIRRLLAEGPVKLIHACSEDLEVLAMWAGSDISPLVDTQIAESLLGTEPGIGYRRLVAQRCGVDLPKEETRSNWLERPLTPAQREYAVLDVAYLPMIWAQQREALVSLGRLDWLDEECGALVQARRHPTEGQWFKRQRQLWRLEPRQIEAYRQLTDWREREIRARDLPRGWLAKDGLLFAIAEAMPKNRFELAAVEGVTPKLVKREGDTLLALVKQAHQCDAEALPVAQPVPTSPPFKRRLKALKGVVQTNAEALGLAPERLSSRAEMEAIVTAELHGQPLPLPGGWRGACLAEAWRQALATEAET